MRELRSLAILLGALLGALATGLWAPAALADLEARTASERILESLPAKDSGIDLQVQIESPRAAGESVRIGDEISYRFTAKKDAYLTAVFLDAHGVITVLYPSLVTGDNRLAAGETKIFPDPASGYALNVEPPLGLEDLFAVATLEPIAPEDLGITLDEEHPVAILEAADGAAFAKRFKARLEAEGENRVAFAQVNQRVAGRDETAQYTPEDVVVFFTTRTRSIQTPKLSMNITFDVGSSELTPAARKNLDSIGAALGDRRMKTYRFTVGGHTDDTGGENLNLDLSRARAASVERYLTSVHNVEGARLKAEGYGEARPLESNDSELGRRANRRVEFTLAR